MGFRSISLLIIALTAGSALPRARRAIAIAESTGKKGSRLFSAMPADGMTAAHSPGEDFGTSRSHPQLSKGYAVSQTLGNASDRRVLNTR